MSPMVLTATPPITTRLDDSAERQAYEAHTPETVRRDDGQELLARLNAALDALAGVASDWDSYGALPPSRATVQHAWSLASGLVERGVPIPQVFPTRDGGVQFEWHLPTGRLEWEIDANLSTAVFVFDDYRTGEEIDGELPQDVGLLAQALARVSVA